MKVTLAMFLGTVFGYTLHRVGATDSDKLLSMLRLRNLGLAKTILLAIGFGAVLLFGTEILGLFNTSHFSIKPVNYGVVIGGIIFGIGWGISGICPGTSLSALGTGKKDSGFYIIGGILGAYLLTCSYSFFENIGLFRDIFEGRNTLVQIYDKVNPVIHIGPWGGVIFGLAIILLACILPEKIINDKSKAK